jgi:polyisoprenoid-binding protein YceI
LLRWTLLLLVATYAPVFAAEDCYTADATGGEVTFRVMQAGAPFSGRFRRFSGEICFTQSRLTHIDASLDPASVDTGLPELDAALIEKDFFAIRDYPRVTFVSTSVQSQGDTQTVRGTLEIKGNRRDVDVVLHLQQAGGKMSISGSFILDRLQYGIGMGDWTNTKWLGAEVKLDISATLTLKK